MLLVSLFLIIFLFKDGRSTLYNCENFIEDHPCKNVISSKTLVPNLLSHSSQEIAIRELSELHLSDVCSDQLKFFLCSVYAPPCSTDNNYPIPPCRSLCESIKANCDILWPNQLDCSKFPESGGYCKCENGSTIAKPDTKIFTCQSLPSQPVCKYQETTFTPNLVGDETPEIAVKTISQIIPLIKMGCSPHLAMFVCSIFLPNCTDVGVPYPPCNDLCQSARTGCEPVMKMFGFPWPEQFECDNFPDNSCVTHNGSVIVHEDTEEDSTSYVCEDIESDSMCKVFSDKTIMPNLMNQSNQEVANNEILKFSPLVMMDCSPDFKTFVCSLYFPKCDGYKPKPPCKSLCEKVKNECTMILMIMGSEWPEEFKCNNFRNTNCVRSASTRKSHDIKEDDRIVTLPSGGQLLGSIMETRNNEHPIFAFRGIPFAEAPIGELRYKPPVAKRLKATGKPFDATAEGPECIQVEYLYGNLLGVEDCLVLNVYTRSINKTDILRPVMVSIHGGGFTMGSGASYMYSPQRLLDYDVVLVTMNYRLNSFGFLATTDEASPGNYGLLDQTEALKWVRDNIEVFNGDPNKVNIFGISAGSASVMYHLLSPLSKGLFHSAIAQSGNTLCPWAEESETVKQSLLLADDLGCTTTNSTKMVNCLRQMPTTLLNEQLKIHMENVFVPFGPVRDNTFLPNSSYQLLEHGYINNVPLMIGITEIEGASLYTLRYKNPEQNLTDEFLLDITAFAININPKFVPKSAVNLVRDEYFNSVDPNDTKKIREISYKLLSDSTFVAPHFQTIHFLTNHDIESFVYSYDLFVEGGLALIFGLKDFHNTTHGDDMPFLFMSRFTDSRVNQTEHLFLQMWTKFAEFGHPTKFIDTNITQWPVSKKDDIQIYHLNHEFQVESYDPKMDKVIKFWFKDFKEAMKVH